MLNKSELEYIKSHMPSSVRDSITDEDVYDFYKKNISLFVNDDSIEVSNISNSRTSNGVLLKWNIKKEGKFYFVKTGERSYHDFLPYKPISEFIATKVGNLLGLDLVQTELENISLFDKDILTSKTESFLNDDEMFRSVAHLITDKESASQDLLQILFNKFPNYKENIYTMIVFDFLINNLDRHLNNFGFICNEVGDIRRFAPLFDNGSSFFADLSEDRLTIPFLNLDRESSAKPFRTKQYKQIKLVPKDYILYLEDTKEIFDVINSFNEMSLNRRNLIKKLITFRNDYLKGLV